MILLCLTCASHYPQVFTKILHEPLQFSDPSWGDISWEAKDMISR